MYCTKKYGVTVLKRGDFSIQLRIRCEPNLPEKSDDHSGKVKQVYQSDCEEKLGNRKRMRKEWIAQITWKRLRKKNQNAKFQN